jgi:hypothetical protein
MVGFFQDLSCRKFGVLKVYLSPLVDRILLISRNKTGFDARAIQIGFSEVGRNSLRTIEEDLEDVQASCATEVKGFSLQLLFGS